MPTILSLFDLSGVWCERYAAFEYKVIQVDLAMPMPMHAWPREYGQFQRSPPLMWTTDTRTGVLKVRADIMDPGFVNWLDWHTVGPIVGILAAPPCRVFCRPGARLWSTWDADGTTAEQVALVRHTLHLIDALHPRWWALENPPGRLQRLVPELGEPTYKFHPFMHGDPWTKHTYVWGAFVPPAQHFVAPEPMPAHLPPGRRDHTSRRSSSWRAFRAQTPPGFARDFFEANP